MAVTNASGTLISQQRYLPFGGERTNLGSISQTDYGYTGQRDLDLGMGGLMDYKARFYSPYLNHFIQPDSIVPDPTQGLNRYAYVVNNPIRYADPSGHCVKSNYSSRIISDTECEVGDINDQLKQFGIKTRGLNKKEKEDALYAAQLAGIVLGQIVYGESKTPEEVFKSLHGDITIKADSSRNNCETIGTTISCGSAARYMTAFLHEFGHVFDNHAGGLASDLLGLVSTPDNADGYWSRSMEGFKCYPKDSCFEHSPSIGYYLQDGSFSKDQTIAEARDEQWADIYLNGIYNDATHGFTDSRRALEFLYVVVGVSRP